MIYRDIIRVRRSGNRAAASDLSLQLAHQRLRRSDRDYVAVLRVPRQANDRFHLDRVLQSLGLGRIRVNVTWEHSDAGGRLADLVLLVPVAAPMMVEVLKRRAVTVAAAVGDIDDLAGAIRLLRPGWRLVAFDLRPGTFVEAVAEG